MSKQKHTPGPWVAYNPEQDKELWIMATYDGHVRFRVAVVDGPGNEGLEGAIAANARLIEQAPEMKELLELAVHYNIEVYQGRLSKGAALHELSIKAQAILRRIGGAE